MRFEEALREFRLSRADATFLQAPRLVNPRVRALSKAHAHVHLVDFERELDRVGPEEGIGCNFFSMWSGACDNLHPNDRTNGLIAEVVARKVLELRNDPPGR